MRKAWELLTHTHALALSLSLSLSLLPAFVGFVAEAIVRVTVRQTESCNTSQTKQSIRVVENTSRVNKLVKSVRR